MLLDSRSRLPSPSPKLYDKPTLPSSDTSESSLGSHDSDPASLATCYVPTASLLVTNLPTILFSQAQDLHPLFFPFGHIEKLEIVQVSPLGTMSVVVQYSAAHVAKEAKETLSGQLYGNYRIEARYVNPIALDLSTSGLMSLDRNTDCTFTPGSSSGQPRAALNNHAGCCDTGRVNSLAHPPQLDFATSSFFHRDSLLISPPRQSPLSMPSVFSGNFQDYDSSRLSSANSRFVYFVHFFLLPKHLIPSVGGTPMKDMDFNHIDINLLCRIRCTTTLSIRALPLERLPEIFGRLPSLGRLPTSVLQRPSLSCSVSLFLDFYPPFACRLSFRASRLLHWI